MQFGSEDKSLLGKSLRETEGEKNLFEGCQYKSEIK